MKRTVWQLLLMVACACFAAGQDALQFFTNQANASLRAQFGFGITNIPVYCPTNPGAAYSASIHYVLQSAANNYDATTPASNLPSVFRPLLSWQNGTLFITGYVSVSNNFLPIIAPPFKNLADPSITTNDNVWGIPLVVGMKGQIPAFNEYSYASEIGIQRLLYFVRATVNGLAITNKPPLFTNQFYIMSISNIFGSEAWNFYQSNFTRPAWIFVSNEVSITFTNNDGAAITTNFSAFTNIIVTNWPGWTGGRTFSASGVQPLTFQSITLPQSYWSESTAQFQPWGTNFSIPQDWRQTSWPVHQWTLNITNNFLYALIDLHTRRVLDCVNLGGVGSSVNLTAVLAQTGANQRFWDTNFTMNSPNVPSDGLLNQISQGIAEDPSGPEFLNSLNGGSFPGAPVYPSFVTLFECPFPVSSCLVQTCSWQAQNPLVHYTPQDLAVSPYSSATFPIYSATEPLSNWLNLGTNNPLYASGAVSSFTSTLAGGSFQIGFNGSPNLPYIVWASSNLIDWNPAGPLSQPSPGVFQFQDPLSSNYSKRFYQLSLP